MQKITALHSILLVAALVACGPGEGTDSTATTGDTTPPATDPSGTTSDVPPGTTSTDPTTGGTNPTTTTVSSTDMPTTDPTTTDVSTTFASTTDVSTTGASTGETGETTGGGLGYKFMTLPFDDYVQNDRHGAVEAGTAGIRAQDGLGFNPNADISIRDPYNQSNPVEDANGMWLGEIADSIMFFHDNLDDDLVALGLVPATFDETLMQAGPVIVPDTIKYDPKLPTAYPNGRTLTDPVVDLTLAAVLLKLGGNQPLDILASVPLNPPENDVPFTAEFPYLAPPHLP